MSAEISASPVTAGEPTHLTDVGNAARFARDNADLVRYCSKLGWLIWDGARWKANGLGEAQRLARETVRGIYSEASRAIDGERQRIAKWAAESESLRRIEAMLVLARSELHIDTPHSSLDRNEWLLNTLSGTVDLKTGGRGEHNPADRITKVTSAFYSEQATCPKWLTFLDRIMGGKLDLIEFLQRAVGYSLTGDTSEQVLFVLWGSGANGKSVLLEVLRSILGDYARHTPAESLVAGPKSSGIPNDLARLRGARFVTAVETEDGRRLAEGLVKQMTGGDTITARFLHQEFFEFRPAFKVWLATNHKPVIRGTDYAIWRRIRLVPFTVTIPPEERDKGLAKRLLEEEATGILAWAAEGCRQWQKLGLAEPPAVLAATEAYREEMDPLNDFMEERCVKGDGREAAAGELYSAYATWAEANGRGQMSSKSFALRLEEKGFKRDRRTHGRYFLGLELMTR
jgi:putative DNA primase/helicase